MGTYAAETIFSCHLMIMTGWLRMGTRVRGCDGIFRLPTNPVTYKACRCNDKTSAPYGYTIPHSVTKNEEKVGRGTLKHRSSFCEIDSDILQGMVGQLESRIGIR